MDADLDLETRFNAVYACNKMATRNRIMVMVSGGILKPLVALCGEEDQHARCQACACLRHLSTHAESRRQIVLEGALVPLATAALVKDLETQREVAACLCHLALADDNRSDIILSGAAQPLLEMAQSPDVEWLGDGAVANVAEDPMTHRAIGHHLNGMHILIYLSGLGMSVCTRRPELSPIY